MKADKKIRLEITQLEFAQLYQEAPEGSFLRKILDRKIEDMLKREYYSDMLKAPTDAEREEARKAYLDKIGVPMSFRW
jgi:hypothetical protein